MDRPDVECPNACWSMDFVVDSLFDGRRFRALTIVDNFSRECLAIEAGQSIKGQDVVAVMERLVNKRGVPDRVQCDNVLSLESSFFFGYTDPSNNTSNIQAKSKWLPLC